MAAGGALFDCSQFGQISSFEKYARLLRNQTQFNSTLLSYCKVDICGALWGVGNPDVSGIGVIAGYIAEVAFGFFLSLCCYICRNKTGSQSWKKVKAWTLRLADKGLESFYFSAIFFTMAVLVASNYSLAKRDFDVSSDGFGIFEVSITSAVTVTSVLPLLYPITIGLADGTPKDPTDEIEVQKFNYNRKLRDRYRLILLGLVLALFIYPFVSQCTHNWAPSDVGQGKGPDGSTIVTEAEWEALLNTCFQGVESLTYTESTVIASFELVGSLSFIIGSLWIFLSRLHLPHQDSQGHFLSTAIEVVRRAKPSVRVRRASKVVLLFCPLLLCIPLLWGIFRLRQAQRALAMATSNNYQDNDWGFGQVVALLLFAPVLFDMIFCLFELD